MKKRINIASKIENLREVEKLVDEFSEKYKLEDNIYGNVLISTLEAANNAILHGNKLNLEKIAIITFKYEEKRLKIIVEDEGEGFDYKNVPDPTAPENIEKIDGRGIFLMNKLADKCEYFENGAKVVLTFNLE